MTDTIEPYYAVIGNTQHYDKLEKWMRQHRISIKVFSRAKQELEFTWVIVSKFIFRQY